MKNNTLPTLLLTLTIQFTSGQTLREKTCFQTDREWKPTTDIRADIVLCYGITEHNGYTFEKRVASWREKGYITHFMTGIAWGDYQDYFNGDYDGVPHYSESQINAKGDTLWHHKGVPYVVPSLSFIEYIKQRHVKRAIDAGIDAIYLEEPEYWAEAGYSPAFKEEWQRYYGQPWQPPHSSPTNAYRTGKLKYHLYYRALDSVFAFAKRYGRSKSMEVRCYVPTHSLVNYAMWSIVSPEASLAGLKQVDGYIAQAWTDTAGTPNYYRGRRKSRLFETAFLEYGCLYAMVKPSGKKVYFLTDPVQDRVASWQDYAQGYQATFLAQLLYGQNADYEVMPWPDRIYEGEYKNTKEWKPMHIARDYSTKIQVMTNALGEMSTITEQPSGNKGIAVAMSNSLMFQRNEKQEHSYTDPQLSNFFGLAMPLVKNGIPLEIVHLENLTHTQTLADVRVLLLSYAAQKPTEATGHNAIAEWVGKGGVLVYSARDNDAYQGVPEWWNTGAYTYKAPADHLFSLMGIAEGAPEGWYRYGKGYVQVLRHDPQEFALKENTQDMLLQKIQNAYKQATGGEKLQYKNYFTLTRGHYKLIAVMSESDAGARPYVAKGYFIDLFDPQLPLCKRVVVAPDEQAFLYDLDAIKDKSRPQVLAAASKISEEVYHNGDYRFVVKAPVNTTNVMRVLLPHAPKQVEVSVPIIKKEWDKGSQTLLLSFENDPSGVQVKITL